jgi:hypothetical protein
MEVKGICVVCGKASKMHTCTMCGALVCSECYDAEKKVCKICASKLK